MLRLLALSAALAGGTVQVDLPELFAGELARITTRTAVPVLLPQRMPVDEDLERHTSGFGREKKVPTISDLIAVSAGPAGGAGSWWGAGFDPAGGAG